jgi:hypothetical protein
VRAWCAVSWNRGVRPARWGWVGKGLELGWGFGSPGARDDQGRYLCPGPGRGLNRKDLWDRTTGGWWRKNYRSTGGAPRLVVVTATGGHLVFYDLVSGQHHSQRQELVRCLGAFDLATG